MPETTANDPPDVDLAGCPRRRRKLIAALLIVHGVLALATMGWLGSGWGDSSGFLSFLLTSSAFGQGSLLGIWIGFGGRATPWRLIGTTIGLVVCTWCLKMGFPHADMHLWGYCVLPETIGTSLLLVLLRFCGLGITWHAPGSPAPEKQKLQFSIRSLMEWTAALAVLLGTLPMMPEQFRLVFIRDILEFCGLCGSQALLTLAVLWTTLGTRWPVARILVLGPVLAAAGSMAMIDSPLSFGEAILHLAFHAFWMVVSLWVLRRAGYRLTWRRTVRL